MATLSISKTYSDNTLLSKSDIDAIIDSVETFVNVTGLNDDNINSLSINATTKIKTATITTAVIEDLAITEEKIAEEAVTAAKIADLAITNAKLAPSTLLRSDFEPLAPLASVGTVVMFHTFNGTISVPRGWMPCNGDVITTTNYDAVHGSGAASDDDLVSSDLIARYLPDFVSKYALGASSTTESGVAAIASTGNTDNQINLEHNHTIDAHNHTYTQIQDLSGPISGAPSAGQDPNATSTGGAIQDESVSNSLSATQDIRPESIEFIFIMKVV